MRYFFLIPLTISICILSVTCNSNRVSTPWNCKLYEDSVYTDWYIHSKAELTEFENHDNEYQIFYSILCDGGRGERLLRIVKHDSNRVVFHKTHNDLFYSDRLRKDLQSPLDSLIHSIEKKEFYSQDCEGLLLHPCTRMFLVKRKNQLVLTFTSIGIGIKGLTDAQKQSLPHTVEIIKILSSLDQQVSSIRLE